MITSRIRQLVSQCCAVSIPIFLQLSYGLSLGFTTVLIPVLSKKDAEIAVTFEELTWISSMNFFANPVGAVISGPLIKIVGRRWMLVLSAVTFLCGWLLLHWVEDSWSVLLGFALLGFASGIADPTTSVYVAEISQVNLRGTMSTSLVFAFNVGVFLQVLFNRYVYWRGLALISTVFPAMALVGTIFIPESPHWLISKGRLTDAKKSLRWLRGWTDSNGIQSEFELHHQSFLSSSKVNTDSSHRKSLKKLYLRREFLLPFSLLFLVFFLCTFNGTISVLTFSVLVFERLESPIDEYTATLLFTVVSLLALALVMLVIRRTGKRKPTLGSLIGAGLAQLAISVYVLLKDFKIIHKESSHSWLPTALILLTAFVSCLGIRCTPWLFVGELFPVDVRGVAAGLLIVSGNLFAALASKTFLYQLEAFTLAGTFLFFSLVNFFGFAILYWTLPETENKTFAEIEKRFAKKDRKTNEGSTIETISNLDLKHGN